MKANARRRHLRGRTETIIVTRQWCGHTGVAQVVLEDKWQAWLGESTERAMVVSNGHWIWSFLVGWAAYDSVIHYIGHLGPYQERPL
jgi:hypothetical protein